MKLANIPTETICIIGTGSFGIAIGKRLMQSGHNIIYGSRFPDKNYLSELFFDGTYDGKYSVTTINQAWHKSDSIIFLAISSRSNVYEEFISVIKNLRSIKPRIVVDVSNPPKYDSNGTSSLSNAEKLENLFKNNNFKYVNIVKGFNLLSEYTLNTDRFDTIKTINSPKIVPICGNDSNAKFQVKTLCKQLGFQANDIGDLKQSLKLENLNVTTYPEWRHPSIIATLILVINFIWIAVHYFFFPKKPQTLANYISGFSILGHLNKVLGFTALQLLAGVYFGSVLASIIQLKNGTTHKLFPKYVDHLLKSRKQYGLWAFLYATVHALLTIFVTNPAYLASWYVKSSSEYLTQMTLIGEVSIITGVVSYTLFILVALSSINSIAESLNWKEWHLVQTKIGIVCLFVGLSHTSIMYLNIFMQRHLQSFDAVYLLTRVKLFATFFPILVLLFRFMFAYVTPLRQRIDGIRNGTLKMKNS